MTPLRPDLPAVIQQISRANHRLDFPRESSVHFSSNTVSGSSVISARRPLSDEHFKACRTAATCLLAGRLSRQSVDRSSHVHGEILVMHGVTFHSSDEGDKNP